MARMRQHRSQLLLLAAAIVAAYRCFFAIVSLAVSAPPALLFATPWKQRAEMRIGRAVSKAVKGDSEREDLFVELETALAEHVGLQEDLRTIVESGRDFAPGPEDRQNGVEKLLEWIRARKQPGDGLVLHSLGPMAAVALRHPSSDREVVVLGTMHGVPGLAGKQNPIPKALYQAIMQLKPDIVAVELDEQRGKLYISELKSSLQAPPMFLPKDEFPRDLFSMAWGFNFKMDTDLVDGLKKRGLQSPSSFLRGLQHIFEYSADDCLAMNFFALCEQRFRGANDWGRDATAAVRAAAKLRRPLLCCDAPQEQTLAQVFPAYSESFVKARQKRLAFLKDETQALPLLKAEERLVQDLVLTGRGTDVIPVLHSIEWLRPFVGIGYQKASRFWIDQRDPEMAKAVNHILAGEARTSDGNDITLEPAKRAVLWVGGFHTEGVARALMTHHGYEAVEAPLAGWPKLKDTKTSPKSKSSTRASPISKPVASKGRKMRGRSRSVGFK